MNDEVQEIFINSDDIAFSFAFKDAPVRGEIVRLGPATADDIISRHNQHEALGKLLGEALALCTLSGASLKFEGRLIIELRCEYGSDSTPIDFLVAEYNTSGTLRGMIKERPIIFEEFIKNNKEFSLKDLFGNGIMLFTIDQGTNMERYQGQVAIDGENIAKLAEFYFKQSEQIETRVILGCKKSEYSKSHDEWRASGLMLQKVAADDTRGDTTEIWEEAVAKFETMSEDELMDINLAAGDIIHRLYHENNVLAFTPKFLQAKCTCNRDRLVTLMAQMPKEDTEFLIENDGQIHARCEFCNTTYHITPKEIEKKLKPK